jgi:hypothetical protein
MPIAKLVMLGVLTEDELAQLIEAANTEEDTPSPLRGG